MSDCLIPRINGTRTDLGGSVHFPNTVNIINTAFPEWTCEAFLSRTRRTAGKDGFSLRLERDSALPQEGCSLRVTHEGAVLKASSENGILHALTTLACLAREGSLPCCEIQDAPRFPHRGLSLDCVRHFFPAEEVKKIIEEMSLVKMNVLHWHLSDDQGWRIESKRFPKLNETGGPFYTQEEIADIVDFSRKRGIVIIPEIDLPGHVSAILAAFPEYSCSGQQVDIAKSGGIFPIILCPGKESTFTFLEDLLSEVSPLFPGSLFHIGGDEAPKSEWRKCPYCQKRIREEGLSGEEELQGYFMRRTAKMLPEKQPVCWNETLLSSAPPENAVIQYWTPAHAKSMAKYAEKGGRWIWSDMFGLYFDYPYSMTPVKKVYEARPVIGEEDHSGDTGLLGMECALWTEHIADAEKLETRLFPRLQALAENCWSGTGDYGEFKARLKANMPAAVSRGAAWTSEDWWDPEGEARLAEALGYLKAMREGLDPAVLQETMQAAAPDPGFARIFAARFFRPEDVPILMKAFAGTL
ncbi:MAG: family 20 glycosylhydrolase [Clostridia bacterium]|nr:family 20 glycosylhydrolase [Clostridia bacterium]